MACRNFPSSLRILTRHFQAAADKPIVYFYITSIKIKRKKKKIFKKFYRWQSKNHKLEKHVRIKLKFVQGFDYRRSVDKSVLINQVRKHLLVNLSHLILNF